MSVKVIRQNALLLIIPALLVSVFACMVCYLGSIVTGEIPMTSIAGQVIGAVIAPLFGIQELFVNELAGQIIKALAFVLGLHAVGLVFLSGICYLVFSHKLHHVFIPDSHGCYSCVCRYPLGRLLPVFSYVIAKWANTVLVPFLYSDDGDLCFYMRMEHIYSSDIGQRRKRNTTKERK